MNLPDKNTDQRAPQQSQGGIGHDAAKRARDHADPATGQPQGAVDVPGPSLDDDGADEPADGRAHHGFHGDDGGHVASSAEGSPAPLQPGHAADLGAARDNPQRRDTPADRPGRGDTEDDDANRG